MSNDDQADRDPTYEDYTDEDQVYEVPTGEDRSNGDRPAADRAYAAAERDLLGKLAEHRSMADPTLERIRLLTELMGDPQHSAPVVQVTGTNGKTSTARMIDTLLTAFGLRTGRLTSPHLETPRERITFSGELIGKQGFADIYRELEPYAELADQRLDRALSFFEVITALGFAAFADAPVDVMVLEVGMGGQYDATNVADAKVAVLTPIAVDHAQYLGSTPAEIAVEKSGIIKPGSTAVVAQQDLDVAEVIMTRAAEVGATVAREGLEFGVVERELAVDGQLLTLQGLHGTYDQIFLPLHGAYQAHNAAVALAAVEAFIGQGSGEPLSADLVREAFASARSPGRLEVVRRHPTIVLDSAHNPHGARATAEAVTEAFSFEPLIGLVGAIADKDVDGVLEALEPVVDHLVCTQNSTPRAMPAEELAEIARDIFDEDRVTLARSLPDAIEIAVRLVEEGEESVGGGGILVTGSVITSGEVRTLLGSGSGERA